MRAFLLALKIYGPFTCWGHDCGHECVQDFGTYQGNTITYYGYFEQVYDSTLQVNVPSLYFGNAADASVSIGTLGVPQM
jgi:hypothetical protein